MSGGMPLMAAAHALHASVTGGDVACARVETDTRKLTPGCLFVALRGANFDGHDFVEKALALGAAAVMVDQAYAARCVPKPLPGPALVVADTRIALGQLAAWWRSTQSARLVAITGSNGKTTVKEMLAAICRAEAGEAAVLATQGNFNNDIGMPLTLLRLTPAHRFAVIEMGMNHPGEIDYLTRLACPDVALVNNALRAHLAGLGDLEAVARAKGEIYVGLKADGVAIVNADDPHAGVWRVLAASHRTLQFGFAAEADVRVPGDATGNALVLLTPSGRIETTLAVPGRHNLGNAAAAAAAALALDISTDAIARGLAAYAGVKGRLQSHACVHGAVLIDDTYNANPDSVLAAVAVLAARPGQRLLVLGDMGELGPDAHLLHREIGAKAKAAGIDRLLCLGELSLHAVQAFGAGGMHFERIEELLAEIEQALAPEVTVLVKGSRFMQMERVVKSFAESGVCLPASQPPPERGHCPPQGDLMEGTPCS